MSQKCEDGRVPPWRQMFGRRLVTHRRCSHMPQFAIVTVIAAIVVVLSAQVESSALAADPEAFAQYGNTLETLDGVKLASLYVTGLEDGNAEGAESELTWTLARLPCPGRSYRFVSSDAAVDSSQVSRSEAQIKILAASLPRGIRCETRIPGGLAQGSTMVTVGPTQRGTAGSPSSEFSSDGTEIKSFSDCLLLSELCTGKFRFVAYFRSLAGELVIRYRFEVARVRSISAAGSLASGVSMNAMGGLQCSIA